MQQLAKKHANQTLVLGGLAGMTAGLVLLGAFPYTAIAMMAAFLIGFSVAGILLPAQTLIQQETPEDLLGRVTSTGMSIVFGAQILGLFLSGLLTKVIGVRQVFLVAAAFLIALVLSGRLFLPRRSV
jgi:MFS family permease